MTTRVDAQPAVVGRRVVAGRKKTATPIWKRALAHLALIIGAAIAIFPFYWAVVMATNTTGDIFRYPPTLTIRTKLLVNIRNMLDVIDFRGSMANTLFVSVLTTVLVLFFDSLAAFVVAKFEFPGKRSLFVLLLATFMVPIQLYRRSPSWLGSAGSARSGR